MTRSDWSLFLFGTAIGMMVSAGILVFIIWF